MKNKKKLITTLIIMIVLIAGLILAANILVSNFNIAELLKTIHGG
jgi:hypothetical protein